MVHLERQSRRKSLRLPLLDATQTKKATASKALMPPRHVSFSTNCTCAYVANGVLDWLFGGLAMAAIVKQSKTA
jgi:hypothetical protein